MTIKTPVRVENLEGSTPWFGSLVEADGNPLLLSDIAAALNATADAPDLTALVDRILSTLHHQGLTTWGCLSIEDAEACRAEAYAAVMDILKDATPAPAPDLTALEQAVEEYRDNDWNINARRTLEAGIRAAALDLFPPKDGTP